MTRTTEIDRDRRSDRISDTLRRAGKDDPGWRQARHWPRAVAQQGDGEAAPQQSQRMQTLPDHDDDDDLFENVPL